MNRDSPYYTLGETVLALPVEHRNDADNVRGLGWHAERRGDGHVLSFLRAAQDGGEMQVAISEAEFEQLRREPDAFQTIAVRNGG